MRLNFSNIGGIRLVPHGGGSPVVYGWGTYSRNVSAGSRNGSITIQRPWDNTSSTGNHKTGMLMPGFRDASKPILDVGGRVYIPNIGILTDGGTESFSFGGYLGTKTCRFTYRDGKGATDSAAFDALAVIPAAYSGGLVVRGIDLTDDTLRTAKRDGRTWNRLNTASGFVADGESVYFANASCQSSYGWTWYGSLQCVLGIDFWLEDITYIGAA